MGILPTKYFLWMEPKPFLAALDEYERSRRRWWQRPLVLLVVCALGLVQVLEAEFIRRGTRPAPDAATLLGVGVGIVMVGCVFAYVLPWFITKCPSRITLYDRFLHRSRGDGNRRIPFNNLSSFSLRSGPQFSTLVLTHRSGRQTFIGVPHGIPAEALTAFLSARILADDGKVGARRGVAGHHHG